MLNWLLAGYMWLFIHRPFEVWPILGTIHLERVYMLFVIGIWLSGSSEKRQLGNIFTPAVLFYTFAITVSLLFSPYTNFFTNGDWQDWLKYLVFYVIFMTSVQTDKDLKVIVTGFSIAVFLFMAHSYREFLLGRAVFMVGAVRLTGINTTFGDTNDYGTTLVCTLPMLFPLMMLCKKNWHYLFALGYVLLALRSIQLTGSRTAFIMTVILVSLAALASKHRMGVIPLLFAALPLGWMVLPADLQSRFRTIVDASIDEQANRNYQARVDYFWIGMENWANNPLFGVGPAQHGAPRGGQAAHNLPGQVAGETGTLGVVAFLTMLSCFGINHFNNKKNYKFLRDRNLGREGLYCWQVNIAVMFAILMVLLQGIGLHNAYRFYWVWFGGFQALATMLLQEKVNAVVNGTLRPRLPMMPMNVLLNRR